MHTTNSTTARRFGHIQYNTRYSPIKTLRVQTAPHYKLSLGLEGNVCRAATALNQFCRTLHSGRHNAFVIEIADPRYGKHISFLAIAVLFTLGRLSELDPSDRGGTKGAIGEPRLTFTFAGTAFLVSVFAPCLARADPGDTFGLTSSFLLFQYVSPFTTEPATVALPVESAQDPRLPAHPQFQRSDGASSATRVAACTEVSCSPAPIKFQHPKSEATMFTQTKDNLTVTNIFNKENAMNEFITDTQMDLTERPIHQAIRWIADASNIGGSSTVYILTNDLDSGNEAQDRAPAFGFDLQILFPRDGLPATGRGLIVALDELLLDARGRRDYLAWLRNQVLPLPTIVLSFDFYLDPPTVLRPGLMVAVRLDDDIFRALRDGHIYIQHPDEEEGRNVA